MICEKCGTEMNEIKTSSSTGMECPNCGWGWVTSNIEPIAEDATDYEIWVEPGNEQSTDNIKLVARIANVNFVQAKQLLSSTVAELVYKPENEAASVMPKAQRVQEIAKELKQAGIVFTFLPDFPYDV